jgi:flagellar hook assembly protein FlgD
VTKTPTITLTPTQTATGTLPTHTFTPTATPTNTITMTPTMTSTPGVFAFKLSPKPGADGKVKFQWGLTMKALEVNVKIFTSGFRMVRQFGFDKHHQSENIMPGEHEMTWDGKDEEDRTMPPGNYLCFIEAETEKKTYEASGMTNIP